MKASQEHPLVSIQCTVYNHEPYLRQCLDGFVMQQTNFRFEVIIHDDASTDGSADIIREYAAKYPDIFRPIFQTENQYSQGIDIYSTYLFPRALGRYIALCEGDDYWTDPLKLQKQVDFLEANPEYSMCFGNIEIEDPKCEYRKQLSVDYIQCNSTLCKLDERQAFYAILTNKCRIQTLTVVFRRGIIDKIAPNEVSFLMGDTPMWLDLSQLGKIKYFNDVFGVYRILGNSASHNVNHRARFVLSMYEMRVYYCYKYNFEIPNIVKHKYNVACADYMNSVDGAECQLLYSFFSINWFYDNFIMIIISSKWFLENKLGIRKGVMYINQVYRFLSSKLLKRNILKSI